MKITSTDTTIKKRYRQIFKGTVLWREHESFLLEALTQREDEVRKEIEGMKKTKEWEKYKESMPEGMLFSQRRYAEGYNFAIDDILLRLSQGGKE